MDKPGQFGTRLVIVAVLILGFSRGGLQLAVYDMQQENSVTPEPDEPTCPIEGRTNITFRNFCEMYTECENGISILKQCVDGLYFNKRNRMCDLRKNVKDCQPLDVYVPSTSRPSRKLTQKIRQNFECYPLDIIVKRLGPRRCRVQVVCANGVSFILRRCMQTISFKV